MERDLLNDRPMDLIPLKFAAASLGLSRGYLRTLCRARRVPGAVFDGRRWYLPNGAKVIQKTSGLYRVEREQEPAESRKRAEVASRMQRLAAALAEAQGDPPSEGGDGGT